MLNESLNLQLDAETSNYNSYIQERSHEAEPSSSTIGARLQSTNIHYR